jgi:hypothetical protein
MQIGSGSHPGTYSVDSGDKVSGHEAVTPYNFEVQNERIYMSTAPYVLMVWAGTNLI